jgi:hypothetical protein
MTEIPGLFLPKAIEGPHVHAEVSTQVFPNKNSYRGDAEARRR